MRNRVFLFLDAVLAVVSAFVAFSARFEGVAWWDTWAHHAFWYVVISTPARILVFWYAGVYSRLWRYAAGADLRLLIQASAATVFVSFALGGLLLPGLGILAGRIPLSVLVLDAVMAPLLTALPRLVLRLWTARERLAPLPDSRRVLIIGAGAAGGMIARELQSNPQLGMMPVAFLDDDPGKLNKRLHGIPIVAPIAALQGVAEAQGVDEVIIAMPSAPGKMIRGVVKRAAVAGLKTRTVPGLFEILSGSRSVSALRQVEIQDLLRRDHVRTDLSELRPVVEGQIVLVTGAGGSIGGELCRQLAGLKPGLLVALGRGENSIFEIHQELRQRFPTLEVDPVIADVRDAVRVRQVFELYNPRCVFHAAANKHVPLMEGCASEAVLNNVLGTRNVATMAAEVGTERFVLISTDKAVRPTSVMGATKRIAEQIVHDTAERGHPRYVSVRFGNVLGSRGSVVPTFLRQIEAGGPVTVTHPEMSRYFMTIPEAVQLVLQAGSMGTGGEVFVLDMGEPVKILDLAVDLIRLSGLEVGHDVEIRFTETRPGEKLYEELFFDETNATRTKHPKILRAKERPARPGFSVAQVDALIAAAQRHAPAREIRRLIRGLVPDFQGVRDSGEAETVMAAGAAAPPVSLELVRSQAPTRASR